MKNPFSFLRTLLGGKSRRRLPEAPPSHGAVPLVSASPNGAQEPAPEAEWANGMTIDVPLTSVGWLLPAQLRSRLRQTPGGGQTIGLPLQLVLPQLAHGDVRITFGQLRQAAPHLFSPEDDEDATMVQLPFGELASRCDPALLNYLEQQRASAGVEPRPAPASPARGMAAPESRLRPNLVASGRPGAGKPVPQVAVPAGRSSRPPLVSSPRPGTEPSPALGREPSPGLSRPLAAPVAPPQSASPSEVLLVNLSLLAESWPQDLRGELEQADWQQAQVALPKELVAAGLKEGRLAFRWDCLRSWIRPAPPGEASAHGQIELELPLRTIAPLFLAGRRGLEKPRSRLEVDAEIPDVFGVSRPAGEAAAGAEVQGAARAAATAERSSPGGAGAPAGAARANGKSTPEQLVNRAVQLKGVSGALVTLRDGLLVASHFPESVDAEKVAAFLPQIFSRLGQYAAELQMGELKTLEFLVGQVPWKAFRMNDVLFVVFGRGGEGLPNQELALLAAELGNR